jgi:transposase InsO family protein
MMIINMNDSHICSLKQIKEFLQLDQSFAFTIVGKKDKYRWLENVLTKFSYHSLKKKKERTTVRRYIRKVTGLSRSQLTRLINRHKKVGKLIPNYYQLGRKKFPTRYWPKDIALLIETDVHHKCLSGPATKEILLREFKVFHKKEYENISEISVSHIYNIRNHNRQYNSSEARFFKHTQSVQINIGIRRKPQPNGSPGYLRVDSVHQGDLNQEKGVYHINVVDEVTQYEMIATVEQISEKYLRPVVKELLELFPFVIFEFHADNGSEYINYVTAELLNKLHIELSKSRSRHSNDNALVESKNGSIIRKFFGRNYIPKNYARMINQFDRKYLNIYLNYHRPCGFAEETVDRRGKIRKKYSHWQTPYEKLKSLPNAEQYLKPNFSFDQLDKIAYAESDNEFAQEMMNAKEKLFKQIKRNLC